MMLVNSVSWTVRNAIKRRGYALDWSRQFSKLGEKWYDAGTTKCPKDFALQHFDSFYPNLRQDLTIRSGSVFLDRAAKRTAKDKRVSEGFESDIRDGKMMFMLPTLHPSFLIASGQDANRLPILDHVVEDIISYQAAKKKNKSKIKRQMDKDSDKEDEDDDDDDDDGDDDDEDLVPVDYIDLDVETGNLRLDAVMKTAFPMPRKRIEEVHAEDKIRLNGERVQKRSVDVSEGDVIDCINGRNRENPQLLDIRRIKLLSVPEYKTAKDRVKFKVRRWPSLTIENYQIHPFESMVLREESEEGSGSKSKT